MSSSLDLLTIGDCSMDVFMTPTESEALCQMQDKDCLICFSYGEKIPVKSIEYSVGGNAANNAVGIARMGVKVGLVTTLGGDGTGNQIVEKIEKEGVDMSFVVQQPQAGTNYSTIINYGGERTIFTYHAPRSYEFPVQMVPTSWVYLTSMGESFEPFFKHLNDYLHKYPDTKLAFNPGSRQLRASMSLLEPILSMTYVLYVNREEAERLTNYQDSHGKEKELLLEVVKIGPRLVIITDGNNGSYVYDGEKSKFYHCPVLPVDAYERTGAGDSFGAGFLAATIKGKDISEAMLWGTVNSASVIGYTGSQRGLLKEDELTIWLDRAKSSGVEVKEF